MRSLNMDTSGEYAKLRRAMEFFFFQAQQKLQGIFWDRATEVALEEAIRHLVYRWGPKFQEPLHVEMWLTDTQMQMSITVPRKAIMQRKKGALPRTRLTTDPKADKSLYVVRCLMDRVRRDPSGRQIVFRRLILRMPVL